MLFLIGFLIVIVSVLGGYVAGGGHLGVLWQPFEYVIIFGAAVLGVIHTMGSITEPPEVLGHLIGGALVGTFSGVLLAYGLFGPVAANLKATFDAEFKYFQCIKVGLLAHMNGNAPSVSVEFARKALLTEVRPSFYELEDATQNAPSI